MKNIRTSFIEMRMFFYASSWAPASGLRDDIKERQSTLKINAIHTIYYLVIGDCLRFISYTIIMIKELICVL